MFVFVSAEGALNKSIEEEDEEWVEISSGDKVMDGGDHLQGEDLEVCIH